MKKNLFPNLNFFSAGAGGLRMQGLFYITFDNTNKNSPLHFLIKNQNVISHILKPSKPEIHQKKNFNQHLILTTTQKTYI